MSLNVVKRLALFCLIALTALPAQGTFISEDEWEGDPNTAPSLHKYLYSYQNPTVYVDPDGRAPVLAEMTNGLFSQADYINQRATAHRKRGGLSGHFAATMMNVGAGVHNVLGGAVGLVNTVADVGIAGTAGRLESVGVEFQEYGVVADSRAHLSNVGTSLKQAGNTALNFHDRDVRAELGRGLVETSIGALNGDPEALNNFTTGISSAATGGAISKINPSRFINNSTPNSRPNNSSSGSNVSIVTENPSGIAVRVNSNGQANSAQYAQLKDHYASLDPNYRIPNSGRQTGSGGFSGSADDLYDAIRANPNDIDAIARHTGIKPENIQKVKDHIFNNEHVLDRYVDYGIPAETKRFDSDIKIAESWRRMESGKHTQEDIQLLRHETAERWVEQKRGAGYTESHDRATEKYPAPDWWSDE